MIRINLAPPVEIDFPLVQTERKQRMTRISASDRQRRKYERRNARRKERGREKEMAHERAHPELGRARAKRWADKTGNKAKRKEKWKTWWLSPSGQAYRQAQRNRVYGPLVVLKRKLEAARQRAKKNGLVFEEALFDAVLRAPPPTRCLACSTELQYNSRVRSGYHSRAPSIDRVDNDGGYLLRNVAFLCQRCNAIKADATAEELRAIASYIDRHNASNVPLKQG